MTLTTFWHPHHSFPATASMRVIGDCAVPIERVYGFSESQMPSVKNIRHVNRNFYFNLTFHSKFLIILSQKHRKKCSVCLRYIKHALSEVFIYLLCDMFGRDIKYWRHNLLQSNKTIILPASLLYTIKSPFAKETNTLLSRYLQKFQYFYN